MRRWLLWGPLGLLLIGAAYAGITFGLGASRVSETDVINRYATQYLEDRAEAGTGQGATLSDCVAYPGAPEDRGVWLVVSCGPTPYDSARHYEYYVNRFGRLTSAGRPDNRGEI